MVGNTSAATERQFGQILAPYLADPDNAFVISSDFAHWGLRFNYTYYEPNNKSPVKLRQSDKSPQDPPIHQSIKQVDFRCMGACETGSHAEWLKVLADTGNTVCGRHPIGVIMSAIEVLESQDESSNGARRFKFVRYERSSECRRINESSVSYCSAFAVMES